jgi:ferric-dicitrate binding protein FerR (iron transport regulator)
MNNKDRNNLMMYPGQKAIYDIKRKKIAVEETNIEVETSWKDGRLIFRDTPFEDILKSLSKRYNVRFVVKNETLKRNSFTGTFVHQRLERILERFRISSNIKFRFIENGNLDEEKQIIEVY